MHWFSALFVHAPPTNPVDDVERAPPGPADESITPWERHALLMELNARGVTWESRGVAPGPWWEEADGFP